MDEGRASREGGSLRRPGAGTGQMSEPRLAGDSEQHERHLVKIQKRERCAKQVVTTQGSSKARRDWHSCQKSQVETISGCGFLSYFIS
jgi:hypothetical protein